MSFQGKTILSNGAPTTGVSVSIWTFFRGCYEAMSDLMKKIFYWKNILWPKRLQKNHFCSMYPPLASTTASNLLWAFSLIAHNISASVSSHAVIWLKCFCLKMFLWHPWLQKAYFFSIQTPFTFTMTSNVLWGFFSKCK